MLLLIIVGACLCWTFIVVVGSFRQFRERHTSTRIDVIYEDQKMFPAVTLCNFNQWQRSKLHNFELRMLEYMYSDVLQARFSFDEYLLKLSHLDYQEDYKTLNMTGLALSEGGALPPENFILECTWNGGQNCDYSNFAIINTDLGICYSFNNPSNISDAFVVNKPGIKRGLALTLNIAYSDYILGDMEGAGVKVCHNYFPYELDKHCLFKELYFATYILLCFHTAYLLLN